MNGIFNKSTIETFKKFRNILFKTSIWVFIAGVVVGVLLILTGSSISEAEALLKVLGTLFILAFAMIISSNNFRRLEDGNSTAQVFALIGLISNLLWTFLWILLIWEVFSTRSMSAVVKIATASSSLAALGFFGSNIMSIKEGTKRSTILPLKITSISCLAYNCLYMVFLAIADFKYDETAARFGALAYFTGVIWVIASIIALVLSRQEQAPKNTNQPAATPASPATPSDDQLRAEIEEKVRREMIEKEVRAKMEKEAADKAKQPSDK